MAISRVPLQDLTQLARPWTQITIILHQLRAEGVIPDPVKVLAMGAEVIFMQAIFSAPLFVWYGESRMKYAGARGNDSTARGESIGAPARRDRQVYLAGHAAAGAPRSLCYGPGRVCH